MDRVQTRIDPHLIPAHWGTLSGVPDREWLRRWGPRFVKVVTDDETVPHLAELPPDCLIVVRHYPLSELGHDRGLLAAAALAPHVADPAGVMFTQQGSGRDLYVRGPGAFAPALAEGWVWTAGVTSIPEEVGRQHAAICDRIARWCEARGVVRSRLLFEGLNEPMLWSVEPPAAVARYYRQFLLSLHGYGLHGVCGNFGVGWPGNGGVQDAPVQWAVFQPMIDAMTEGDYLGLHEYWFTEGPGQNWRWWGGRYEQCPFQVPILITECGSDWGVAGQPGFSWQNYPGQMTERARRYVAELVWYLQRCAADGRIHGIFVFTHDRGSATWEWFDTRNEDWLKEFLAQTGTVPAPTVLAPAIKPPPGKPPADKLLSLLQAELGAQVVDRREELPVHPTLKYPRRYSGAVKRLVVHHTAGSAAISWAAIAKYHISKRQQGNVTEGPWPGIAYHYGITPDGVVSILNGLDVVSYHAGEANADSAGIVFAGNFQAGDQPTAAALASYRKLVKVLQAFLGHPLTVVGHRDVMTTECPGAALYRAICNLDTEEPDPALLTAVMHKAADVQELRFNPDAALDKAIAADQRQSTSNEYTVAFGDVVYVCRVARRLSETRRTIYYCRQGDWGNVKTME